MLDPRTKNYLNSLQADLIQADYKMKNLLSEANDGHDLTLRECEALREACRENIDAAKKMIDALINLQRFEDSDKYLEIESIKAE